MKGIERLPPSEKERGKKYYDTEMRSLGLVVYPSNRKVFFITYGPKGQRKQLSLGDFGSLTVDDARKLAAEEMVKVFHGRDPKLEKEDKRYLGIAKKAFGNKLLEEITPTDVQKVFNKRKDKPAAKIKSLPPLPPRQRILSDDEYKRLQAAVSLLPDVFNRMSFELLMATGARLSEVLKAEWSHIDFDNRVWHIPSPKAGKPQSMPLTSLLLARLERMPRPGNYIIAGRDPNKPRNDLKRVWKTLQKEAELSEIHIHDIRRTVGKQITQKHGLLAASKVLRHSDIRVTERHYAPLNDEELRSFLEDRNSELEKTEKPEE